MNEEYWNGVISNMKENDSVKFGTTGKGIHPNYQIISQSGEIRTFLGQNHERDDRPEYNEANLTRGYTLADVNNPMIRKKIQDSFHC